MRGAPAPLKNSVIALLWTRIHSRNCGHWTGKPKCSGAFRSPAHNHQGQGGPGYSKGEQSQSTNQNSLTWAALWFYSVAHDLPRSKRVRKLGSPVSSYLICISTDVTGQKNKSLFWITKTESHSSLINSQTWAIKTLRRKCGGTVLWHWISEMDS